MAERVDAQASEERNNREDYSILRSLKNTRDADAVEGRKRLKPFAEALLDFVPI